MKKIPTLFERDWDGDRSRVLPIVHPGCEWVLAGEGIATRKLDGTCCAIVGGRFLKRHEAKPGKPAPDGFELVATDDETGKRIGWLPIGDRPEDKWHQEAFESLMGGRIVAIEGTYELLGPKIQGNPEHRERHVLVAHEWAEHLDAPRTFDELAEWFIGRDIEGIVWHHPDGRMAKIKGRDFGIQRKDHP